MLCLSRSDNQRCYVLLAEGIDLDAAFLQPAFELRYRIGIFQSGESVCLFRHLLGKGHIADDCLLHKLLVDQDTAVIDPLIHVVVVPFLREQRELFKAFADVALCAHILDAVAFEQLPIIRCVFGKIPGTTAV